MADTESNSEALMRDVFDSFESRPDSPLYGLMSPFERKKGKISRVTFNGAIKPIYDSFAGAGPDTVYDVLSAYLQSCAAGLRDNDVAGMMTNPTLFKALMLLFPVVAERVHDRHAGEYTAGHFDEIMRPMFQRVRKSSLANPGKSAGSLLDAFRKGLQTGFTIGSGAAA